MSKSLVVQKCQDGCFKCIGYELHLEFALPFSVKPFHIAAAAPQQSIPWSEAASQDLEQSCRELPSLMVDVAHHNIPAARFKLWTRLIAAGGVQG